MKASALSIAVFLIICQTAFSDFDCPVLFHGIKGHTACLPTSADHISGSVSLDDIKIILQEHNNYRAAVTPPACMMLKLYWNDDLAYVAQRWANNCKFKHDVALQRAIPGSFVAGQNLGMGFTTWKGVIRAWHNEVKDFIYNGTNDVTKTGHYTQLVWATTGMIGCGFAKCKKFRFHACNYGPRGNMAGAMDRPYKKCDKSFPLKDCKGKVCKNGGHMKQGSCECVCEKYKHIYGPECSVNCSVKDSGPCGRALKEHTCVYVNVPPVCPWMCKTCPYLDQAAATTAAPITTIKTTSTTEGGSATTPAPITTIKTTSTTEGGSATTAAPITTIKTTSTTEGGSATTAAPITTIKTTSTTEGGSGSTAAAAFKYSVMSALPVIVLFLLIMI